MERDKVSEWFRFDSPIGEPEIEWDHESYHIERIKYPSGTIIWFGQKTNWIKEKDGKWKSLQYYKSSSEFIDCDEPLYEKLYNEL